MEAPFQPVYSLGKIHSKHIILEILSFAGKSNKVSELLFLTNKNLRKLFLSNFRVFKNVTKKFVKPIVNDFDHTAQQHYGVNFKVMK